MNFQKLFGQLFILIALSLLLYLGATYAINYRAASTVKLEKLWQEDLVNLKATKKLPSYWQSIKEVKKISANEDAEAEKWVKSIASPIEINPTGEYRLEILFLSQSENEQEKAVIQLHIIHITSGNSVWELGRTYELF